MRTTKAIRVLKERIITLLNEADEKQREAEEIRQKAAAFQEALDTITADEGNSEKPE